MKKLMDVLLVGGGGREHAIAWALKKSPRLGKLYCAPGNGGIAELAECVDIRANDVDKLVRFTKDNAIDFVVVAPEEPLALGLVDRLEAEGISAFGPRQNAAIFESSKAFSKDFMKEYGIPTAEYEIFDDADAAKAYIREKGAPIVVKADGLALGKGVVVAMDEAEALAAVDSMMLDKKFGDSGTHVVIEEFMQGPEVTVLCFIDGQTVSPMPSSQDHKRVNDGDLGPNTGGMGAISPSPHYTPEIADICMKTIFLPTMWAMKAENRPFKGVLYFGLMLTERGPRVIEYNCRFGDPETQSVLLRLKTDILDIFEAVADVRLSEIDIEWDSGAACCVVMASGGYPEKYDTGYKITGLAEIPGDVQVFHAGTIRHGEDLLTNGGRVLGVTAGGVNLEDALRRAYDGIKPIKFKNAHYRTDIGKKK